MGYNYDGLIWVAGNKLMDSGTDAGIDLISGFAAWRGKLGRFMPERFQGI